MRCWVRGRAYIPLVVEVADAHEEDAGAGALALGGALYVGGLRARDDGPREDPDHEREDLK